MKKLIVTLCSVSVICSCNTKDESFNMMDSAVFRDEIAQISEDILPLLDFSNASTKEIEGISFNVVPYLHNERNSQAHPQYLIQDQHNEWVEITDTEDQIIYRPIAAEERRYFNFYLHPTYKMKMVDLETTPLETEPKLLGKSSVECEHCTRGYLVDVSMCTLTTITMSISDGPLPFADYFAAAYFVGCENQAYRELGYCVKHCLEKK